MRRLLPLVALTAGLVAGAAAPASAEACFGTEEDLLVCVRPEALPGVDPNGGSISRCVVIVQPPCTPVTVPVPTLTPGDGTSPVFVDFRSFSLLLCQVIEPPVCG